MKYLGGKQRLGKVIGPILHDIWTTGQSSALSCKLLAAAAAAAAAGGCGGSDHPVPIWDAYIEPFCGSLGVLRVVADTFPASATIMASDYHPDLVQMWSEVQAGTFEYPAAEACATEEDYLRIKAMKLPDGGAIALKAFIGFGLGFGGRYFASFAPKYANGKKEDFLGEMTHSVQTVQSILRKPTPRPTVSFQCRDYRDVVSANSANSTNANNLIYCDPPYRSTRFPIKYRRDIKHYDDFDSDEFWETMRGWSAENTVLVSEMSAPDDFVEVWSMQRYRSACQSTRTRFKPNVVAGDAVAVVAGEVAVVASNAGSSVEYKNEKLFVHKSKVVSLSVTI